MRPPYWKTSRGPALGLIALALASPARATADDATAAQALRIVQNYRGRWSAPPTNTPSGKTVDGPLLGNGDVGVTIGGGIDDQTFYIGKNEFWTLEASAAQLRAVGR